MELISFNTWGGVGGLEGLLKFFEAHRDVDIFCLQEVWKGGAHMRGAVAGGHVLADFVPELYDETSRVLKDHRGYFRPHFHEWFGLAMFVKKSIRVLEEEEIFIYKQKGYVPADGDQGNHARNLQHATIERDGCRYTILNLHGLWNGKGKTDTEDRLRQSDNILNFARGLATPYVLCGDFNLSPATESLKKIERSGLRNLIKEYGVTSTRAKVYTKPERFADYVFVNDGIRVNDFKVLPDEVSDHLPLYLDFQ